MQLMHPIWCLLILAIPLFYRNAHKRRSVVLHTKVAMHRNVGAISLVARLPQIIFAVAWILQCIAMARPVYVEIREQPIRTRDFILSIDISGSMVGEVEPPESLSGLCADPLVFAPAPAPTVEEADEDRYRRIDAARDAARAFVSCRGGDRVALQLFDDRAYSSWPLSRDLELIDTQLSLIGEQGGGGTNFDGPTGSTRIGALQAAINHFRELGESRTLVLVLVTDGQDSIVRQRWTELQRQLRELNVHVYVLGVGWKENGDQHLRQFTEELGGMVIPVNSAEDMRAGFQTISDLESSVITVSETATNHEIFSYFLAAAGVAWLLYLASAALIREEV